jgi:hypothetical protein
MITQLQIVQYGKERERERESKFTLEKLEKYYMIQVTNVAVISEKPCWWFVSLL